MKLKNFGLALAAGLALAGHAAADVSELDSLTVAMTNPIVGQANGLTVSFLSRGSFLDSGYIDLDLPNTFTTVNPAGNCNALIHVKVEGVPATIENCGSNGNGSFYTKITGTIPDGASVEVAYASSLIVNSATVGPHSIHVQTTSGGEYVGEATVVVTLLPPAAIPTLSEWAMILFGTVLAGGAALFIQRRRTA